MRLVWIAALGWAPLCASAAFAADADCGFAPIGASATCLFEQGADCAAGCQNATVRAACAGVLHADCSDECGSGACADDCESACGSACGDNEAFDCRDSCESECLDGCAAVCEGAARPADCFYGCRAACSIECSDACADAPTNCSDGCVAACTTRCQTLERMDCLVECQQQEQPVCQEQYVMRCQAACDRSVGALFCDADFIDALDVEACVTTIESRLARPVQDGDSVTSPTPVSGRDPISGRDGGAGPTCVGEQCEAPADPDNSGGCSFSTSGMSGTSWYWGLILPLSVWLGRRRSVRRSRLC